MPTRPACRGLRRGKGRGRGLTLAPSGDDACGQHNLQATPENSVSSRSSAKFTSTQREYREDRKTHHDREWIEKKSEGKGGGAEVLRVHLSRARSSRRLHPLTYSKILTSATTIGLDHSIVIESHYPTPTPLRPPTVTANHHLLIFSLLSLQQDVFLLWLLVLVVRSQHQPRRSVFALPLRRARALR